jgi:hypothetical protein
VSRRRQRLKAPAHEYRDAEGNALVLRGAMTAGSRREYDSILKGGLDRDDAWQRAAEFLFERLVVSWTIAGLETTRQTELLGRYRLASSAERQFVRETLRAHLAEHFPEMDAP